MCMILFNPHIIVRNRYYYHLYFTHGETEAETGPINSGPSDSRVSVYAPRSWWMKRYNLCLKQQSQIMNTSPPPPRPPMCWVVWCVGVIWTQFETGRMCPKHKRIKKRRKERKPSCPGVSFHRARKAFMTCCDSEAGSWHSFAVN